MKKILVIGANGFTGRHILNDLAISHKYEITGCSLNTDIEPNHNYHFIRTDIRNKEAVSALFEKVQPDIVINTSALSVPDYCEIHREEAYTTNVAAVKLVACACQQYNSRFIHLSTDFVFDGNTEKLYIETDEPKPGNYYGVTKLKGEQQIAEYCNNYAIARVVVVYGKALPGQHGNIFQLTANKLRAGEIIRVVSDQWRTPTFVGDISQGVELLMYHPQNGVYHICGCECVSIADIAYRVAEYLGLNASLIHPVTTKEMGETTQRPRFSGLNIEKARKELNYKPHTLEEGIIKMFL